MFRKTDNIHVSPRLPAPVTMPSLVPLHSGQCACLCVVTHKSCCAQGNVGFSLVCSISHALSCKIRCKRLKKNHTFQLYMSIKCYVFAVAVFFVTLQASKSHACCVDSRSIQFCCTASQTRCKKFHLHVELIFMFYTISC